MATKKPSTQKEREPTQLIVGKEYFTDQLNSRIQLGKEILNRQIQTMPQLNESKKDYYNWDDYNSELLKQFFNNEHNEYKQRYDTVNTLYGFLGGNDENQVEEFVNKLKNKIDNLSQLVEKVDLMKSQVPNQVVVKEERVYDSTVTNNDVFIVHGHNNEIKINVARTLEKLGLNPIILHEQANSGKTIIEKFEEHSKVGFAIVLLTDDDLGKAKRDEDLNYRARQNVVLELGYFIGKLGRNRVCPLYTKGVELPSDLYGLLYVEIDPNEYWKINIAKELKAAGYDVDVNKII
ncbi:TIR domain-containing protein [Mucilaginibacter sp. OK283]|uniref:TIR domain-containing protein n=1 Tax=Mucilaginibacter sp. OK283 TaxID=1881049 RepID=UPI0008C4115C|nr:nucleotide-binding protein [Mucilaginibacter sp. OK283]SEO67906.1 Predicted nucleotide-binding protein containing TIR-like domain-containing protein [Mucilaginibacter sp. OK283]